MGKWWESLSIFEQFFYSVGIVSLFLMFIIAVMILVGLDPVSKRIATSAESARKGIRLLSLHTLAAFLLGYGWGGIICLRIGLHEIVALLLSVILGFLFMLLMYFLMLSISGLYSRDPAHLHVAVGAIAEVFSTIPGNRAGTGKIQLNIDGELMTLKAETNSPSSMKPGEQVRVIDRLSSSLFLVREK